MAEMIANKMSEQSVIGKIWIFQKNGIIKCFKNKN